MYQVCVYEPTAKAPPSIKLKFYDDLQDTIDRIPHNDILVMLGWVCWTQGMIYGKVF